MIKNKIYFTLFFTACISAILIYEGRTDITAMINSSVKVDSKLMMEINEIYKPSIEFSKLPTGTINSYIPCYGDVAIEIAEVYAKYFNMQNLIEETDDYFLFGIGDERLYINRNANHIKYESDNKISGGTKLLDDKEAIKLAGEFISNNRLILNFEEVIVEFDGEYYCVEFVSKLGNLKNFGFTDTVLLDLYGNVISMDYYYLNYERFHNIRIKSMQEAFYELPLDFEKGMEISIDSCQLVYYHQNSILQPAYLFEGNINNEELFTAFVMAAVY